MNINSCFPEVENNKFIQDAIIAEVFKLLESSHTEKELQDKINNALEEEVAKGTINLDNKEINTISEKLGPALAALAACKIEESLNTNLSPADLANSITSFLCNLPKFNFELFRIKFDFDLEATIEAIKELLIKILLDILFSILSNLLTIVIDLCEFSLDIGFGNQIEQILNSSFLNLLGSKILGGFNLTIDILIDIFAKFGIDFSTGNFIGETGEDCTPAITTMRPASEFLSSISQSLSSKEMCQLLNGNATPSILNKIKEILEFEYPTLFAILDTDEKITELFKTIGYYINPTACVTQPEAFNNLCNFNDLTQVKKQLLESRGLTPEQVQETLDVDAKRLKDKMFKVANLITKLRENPDSIFDGVSTNLLCAGNKSGKFKLSDFKEIVFANKVLAGAVYHKINESYILDSQKSAESNIKFITKRKYIPKVVERYIINNPATGESEVVGPIVNPMFISEADAGNKTFVVVDSSLENGDTRINIAAIKGFPSGDYFIGDYSKIIANPDAFAEIYNVSTDYIVGVVADYKERVSPNSSTTEDVSSSFVQEQFSLTYELSGNNVEGKAYKTFKVDSITELYLKKPNVRVGLLTENSLIQINEASTTRFDVNKFQNSEFEIQGVTRRLSTDELSSLESSKVFYKNFEASDGPFRPVDTEIVDLINRKIPSLEIDSSGRSSQEQVFVKFAGSNLYTTGSVTPYDAYSKFALSLSQKINEFNISSLEQEDYQSFVDLYFVEGLLRTRYEKEQYLNKFLNDPCSLSLESFEKDLSPAAAALIAELTRLFIKVHVIKNVVKNMPYLYHFDTYELVKHDDSFIEFTLQTLKNEIEYFTTSRQQFNTLFDTEINAKFQTEFESNDLTIFDPITNIEYTQNYEDFSLDFKYRYFIKKEFMGLLKSFRQAYFLVKRQQPINFDTFMVSTISYDDLKPNGFNLVACYLDDKKEVKTRIGLSDVSDREYAAIFLVLNSSHATYEIEVSSIRLSGDQQFVDVREELIQRMKTNDNYRILIEFCFNSSKYLSFNFINESIVYSKNSYESTSVLMTTSRTIRDLMFQLLSSTETNETDIESCYNSTFSDFNLPNLPDEDFIKQLFLRFLLEVPLIIIKLLAERFDPSISINNQIRNLVEVGTSIVAGQKIELPILPFVLALWPVNWIGYGPPITTGLGVPYLIIDTIQTTLALTNLKLKKVDLFAKFQFEINGELDIENPYPSEC